MRTSADIINAALDRLMNKEITPEQYLEVVSQVDSYGQIQKESKP